MNYKKIYEQVKHLPEITTRVLVDTIGISRKSAHKHLQTMGDNWLVKKTGTIKTDMGQEMFIYSPLDQTRCDSCRVTNVKLYQRMLCKDCLHKQFEKVRPLIDQVRGV